MVPPRVLVVSPDRALRALVRAELREAGYDAIGASSFAAALEYPPAERERGPVRLLIVHEGAVDPAGEFLERARLQFPGSRFLLVAGEGSGGTVPAGPWDVECGRSSRFPRRSSGRSTPEPFARACRKTAPSRRKNTLGPLGARS